MSYYLNHPEFFNGPIGLTEEERNNPLKIVSCFFDDYSLSEIREHNQQMDHVCLSTDTAPFQEPGERDRLLCYRKDEERALEAAFILSQNHSSSKTSPLSELSTQKVLHHLIGEIDLTEVQKRLVELQHKLAQLCLIVANAYSSGVDKLVKP